MLPILNLIDRSPNFLQISTRWKGIKWELFDGLCSQRSIFTAPKSRCILYNSCNLLGNVASYHKIDWKWASSKLVKGKFIEPRAIIALTRINLISASGAASTHWWVLFSSIYNLTMNKLHHTSSNTGKIHFKSKSSNQCSRDKGWCRLPRPNAGRKK